MSKTYSGHCLCGKIRITVNLDKPSLGACHCNTCRKWSAGPLMTFEHKGDIAIEGDTFIRYYPSSDWATRCFCKECGSHLFYKMNEQPLYYIAAWILNNVEDITFDMQVYIDKKPTCYAFINKTQTLTETEILAMFS